MPQRRLLAMMIAFLAAISIMAPLSFFAGLERGRGLMDASAADMSQTGTVPAFGVNARNHRTGPSKLCDSAALANRAWAQIICRDAPQTRVSNGIAPARRSQALSDNVIASISEFADPRKDQPMGLAMALDGLASVGQDQNSAPAPGSPGFSGLGGIPGAITPFGGPGANGVGPPSGDADDPTAPGGPGTGNPGPDPDPGPGPDDPKPPVFEPPDTDMPETPPTDLTVPLPGAVPLFFSGLAVLLGLARRRAHVSRGV